MPVGGDAGDDAICVLLQIGEVGQDQVDARHLQVVGEHQPAVEQDDLPFHFDAGTVAPDLAEAPEEDDPYGIRQRSYRGWPGPSGHGPPSLRERVPWADGSHRRGAQARAASPWWGPGSARRLRSRTRTTRSAWR